MQPLIYKNIDSTRIETVQITVIAMIGEKTLTISNYQITEPIPLEKANRSGIKNKIVNHRRQRPGDD